MHNFRNLKIWQKSRILVKEVFFLIKSFPVEERFGLVSQILRSAYSIPSNIAEGSGGGSTKKFARFLDSALSSAFELETQLILATDINYISESQIEDTLILLQENQKMIYSFKTNLKD